MPWILRERFQGDVRGVVQGQSCAVLPCVGEGSLVELGPYKLKGLFPIAHHPGFADAQLLAESSRAPEEAGSGGAVAQPSQREGGSSQ